jgi:hypothetical protein
MNLNELISQLRNGGENAPSLNFAGEKQPSKNGEQHNAIPRPN